MSAPRGVRRRWLRITLYTAAVAFLVTVAVGAVLVLRFQPIARDYFISALKKRYQSDIELGNLQISLYPTVRASGDNLVFWFQGRHDRQPLVQIRRFSFETGFFNFFRSPKHINRLRLEGLQIHIPPRSEPAPGNSAPSASSSSRTASSSTTAFVLDEVIADGTMLEVAARDPAKYPLAFDITRLTLRTIAVGRPMAFHAELTNPKPPGLIQSDGRFGPWNAARPADTPLFGNYTLRDADLSVFKGITGKLSSDGLYNGQLGSLEVQGTTDVPDFALTIGGHSMLLHTDFKATVDGTNGNTVLHPVHARLGRTGFDVSGSIERNALETHKTILLEARTSEGTPARIEDFLRLAVKSPNPPMTGGIRFDSKVKIPPGTTEVIERLQLDGTFGLAGIRFTSPDVQGKIAGLSHRAQGDPNDHDSGVTADFRGVFHLNGGQLGLPELQFTVPGAKVSLHGGYALRSGALDFQGTVKLDATVSQMTTGFKSKLLRPFDPLFRRDGAGTVLPIAIGGTRGEPSFRLDIGRVLRRN
jgi:hypothetical protein